MQFHLQNISSLIHSWSRCLYEAFSVKKLVYILTQMINTILLFRFLTHCEKRTTIIKFISGLWREGCAVIFFLSFRESSYQMSYPISFFKGPSLPFVSTYLGTYLRWICKNIAICFCFSKFGPNVSLLDNARSHPTT